MPAGPMRPRALTTALAAGAAISVAATLALAAPANAAVPTTVVQPTVAGSITPAAVNSLYNPDQAAPGEVEVNGTLYGTGFATDLKRNVIEQWTDTGWQRFTAPGMPTDAAYSPVDFGGDLYFTTWTPGGQYGTARIWKYDGTSVTKIGIDQQGFANVFPAGDRLDIFEYAGGQTVKQYDGTTVGPMSPITNELLAAVTLNGTSYIWTDDNDGETTTISKIDENDHITAITKAPYAQDGVVWNGAIYFGGDGTAGAGIYRFDGTSVSAVDVGNLFGQAEDIPSVGAVGDDLYFTADVHEKSTDLYSFDGATTNDLGRIGTTGSYAYYMTAHAGDLYMGVSTGDTQQTWVYDAASTVGDPIQAGTPTVTGNAVAGQTLSAAPGEWTPTATFSYQWNRDGVAIAGATAAKYQLGSADYQHTVSVTVTGSQAGFASASATSTDSAAVQTGTMVLAPAVSGTPTVGQTLTAATPGLVPATATLTYRWLRSGKPITGATGHTYRATSSDAGHALSVTVSANGVGFVPASKTSAARTIGKAFTKSPTPAVVGTFAVGHTVAAVHGTWSPTPALHYQWFRSGSAIAGAVKSTYKLTASDRGKSVTVQVIGIKAGYTTVYKMSGGHTVK